MVFTRSLLILLAIYSDVPTFLLSNDNNSNHKYNSDPMHGAWVGLHSLPLGSEKCLL